MRIPMLLKKINRKLAKLIPVFVLVLGFFVFKGVLAANYWVTDPIDCPSTNQTYYPGQNCDNLDICGTLSGNVAQCYDTSGVVIPSVTGTSDTIYSGSLPSGYILDCFATDSSVNGGYCSNNGDWWCNASSTCSDLNRETDCAANQVGVATCGGCSADAHACDGSFVDADGCEIQDGATCVSSDGLIGVYDNCNGAEGFCRINANYFETGVNVRYATSSSLLWGTQYGSGNLMELSASNTPGGIFTITNDGRVGIGTSTLSANNMLTVGLDAGSQFIVSKYGVVTNGTWQAGIIGLAYGGTGLNLSTSTGFLYLSNGTSTATTTIYIGNTDLAVANSGGSTLLSYIGNTITLDTAGNWMGTVEGIDISSASSTWDATTGTVNAGSGNWNNTYDIVSASSTSWTMAYNAITASSTYWDTAYGNRVVGTSENIIFTNNTIGVATDYNIPLIASTTNWNNAYNSVSANTWLADADFASNGLMIRTANGAYTNRIATGTNNEVIVLNGDGIGGDLEFGLPDAVYLGTNGRIGRDADNFIDFGTDNEIRFNTNNANVMVLDANGYIGLGTTTPGAMLNLFGVNNKIRFSYDAANYGEIFSDSNGHLILQGSEITEASIILGSGLAQDVALKFDGSAQDYYAGIDDTDDIFKFGVGSIVGATPALSITSAGNIGIGTTSPGYKLDVKGSFNATSIYSNGALLTPGSGSNWSVSGPDIYRSSGNVGIGTSTPGTRFVVGAGNILLDNDYYLLWGDTHNGITGSSVSKSINLATNNAERMRIDSSGNVGIGTSTPAYKLTVDGEMGENLFQVATSTNAGIFIINADGKVGIGTQSPTSPLQVLASNQTLTSGNGTLNLGSASAMAANLGGSIALGGVYTGTSQTTFAGIAGLKENATNGDVAGYLAFYSRAAASVPAENMRITSTGRVGIGTTNPMAKLHSTGITPLLMSTSDLVWGTTGSLAQFEFGATSGNTYTKLETFINGGSGYGNLVMNPSGGNVGVGITNPGYKLEVNGSFNATSVYSNGVLLSPGTGSNWSVNGANIYRSAGNVGIGTSSPQTKLEVWGETRVSGVNPIIRAMSSGTGSGQLFMQVVDGATPSGYIGTNIAGMPLAFTSGSNVEALRILSNGNVGIGTSSPGQKLTVVGGDITLRADDDLTSAIAVVAGTTEGYIYVNNAGSSKVFLSAHSSYDSYFSDNLAIGATDSGTAKLHVNGNVGIGTTDPLASLQISGGYNTAPSFTNTAQLRIVGTGSGGTGNDAVIRFDTPSNSRLIYMDESDSSKLKFTGGGGTDLVTIDNEGDVGIGTSSPGTTKLRVTQATTNAWAGFIENTDSADSYGLTVRAGNDSADASFSVMNRTSGSTYLQVRGDGNVGIGTAGPGYILDVQHASSKVNSKNGYLTNGADYAEYFYTDDIDLASGETVCIDVAKDNTVKRCERGADNNVMGIVSTNPSIVGNGKGVERDNDPHYKIIGMLGQVPALVTNDNGPINPGDSLTSASTTPGFLMRANAGDSTVGIALESFDSSAGRINVLISRRNKSLTVETVEAEVSKRIADMAIEDDVRLMISDSLASLNVDDQIKAVVANELNIFDSRLTLKFDDISGQITNLETKYIDLDTRLARVENNFNLMNDELDQASTTMAQMQKSLDLLSEKTITSVEIFDPFQDASTTVLIADIIASHEVEILNLQNEVAENKSSITTLESKVLTIEDRMALLEGANSEATSTVLSDSTATDDSIFDMVVAKLNLFGVFVSDKIIGVKNLIADLIDTREIKITQTDNASDNIIGEGMISAGATSTVIISNKIATSSKIFVTFRSDYGSRWWIGDQTTGTSTVVIAEPLTTDIYFDWWVIGVNAVVPIVTNTEEVAPIVDINNPIEANVETETATTTEVALIEEEATTTISDLVDNIETVATTTE